ncbi:hypothetical protein ACFORL_12395 [Legionella dresdenensis]|uniref:Uncharacterized protein n=1 Tax=Legionella dresdenensis TaxID=450200 RepID=A0ABV8CII4_9GAMM
MSEALSNINTLLNHYQKLNAFKRWFFPGKVAQALKEFAKDTSSARHAALVYQAYFKHTNFFTRWLFSCLLKFSELITTQELQSLNNSMLLINSQGQATLKTEANFEKIVKATDIYDVVYAWKELHQKGLLAGSQAQDNFDTVFHSNWPIRAAQGLYYLNRYGLLNGSQTQAIREIVVRKPDLVYEALTDLYEAEPLKGHQGQANFIALANAVNPKKIIYGLKAIQTSLLKGSQAQANFDAVLRATNIESLSYALDSLGMKGLLKDNHAQANFDTIVGSINPENAVCALEHLNRYNLLTGEWAHAFRRTIASVAKPLEMAKALESSHRLDLFTGERAQANFDMIVRAADPWKTLFILWTLQRSGLLTGEQAEANFNAVFHAADPNAVLSALQYLNEDGLLTGEQATANRNAVASAANPKEVKEALLYLHWARLLTGAQAQGNFNAVIVTHAALLTAPWMVIHWSRIPRHVFTQACLDDIIALAATHHNDLAAGQAAITRYLIRLIQGVQRPAQLNQNQSTHTASVHATTDLTAWLLSSKYSTLAIDIAKQWQAMVSAVTAMTPSEDLPQAEIEAAIRCLARLTQQAPAVNLSITANKKANSLTLIEKLKLNLVDEVKTLMATLTATLNQESRIGLQTFIVWVYEAVKDNPLVMELFTKALFEIQRGYNLNEQGQDEGGDDKPICYGGTANKFCEKLSSFSPFIEFIFVDKETINLKMQQLTRQAALTYLKQLHHEASNGEPQALTAYQQALAHFNENRERPIYQHVFDKNNLTEVIMAEFDGLYDKEKLMMCIQQFKEHGIDYLKALTHEKDYQALINHPPHAIKQFTSPDGSTPRFFNLSDQGKRSINPICFSNK